MPKISVIIPVYNVEDYLGSCLDSILGQTLREIEVLCVDDGSTDGSLRMLRDYAARDARVRVLQAEHRGAFRAREVGVKAATGEFIYFMDADDLLDTEAFAELYELASREGLDQVVFASTVFCEGDISGKARNWAQGGLESYYSVPSRLAGRIMSGMELMGALLDADHFHVSPPLRLIRASVIQQNEYGFPDATSRADNYFTPISLYYSKRACAIPNRYYRRRVRNGSITTAPGVDARLFRNLLVVMVALFAFPPFTAELGDQKSVISRFAAQLATGLTRFGLRVPCEERFEILTDVLSTSVVSAPVVNALFLAVKKTRKRPNTVMGCLKFIACKILQRG